MNRMDDQMNYLYKNSQVKMKKSSTMKGAAVLLLVGLVSFMAWDNTQEPLTTTTSPERLLPYQTSATRTANVGKYCVNGVDRTSLVTTADISTAKTNRKAVDSSLGIDGNSLIYKAVNGDTGGALSMVTGSAVNLGIFVGVFLVPFVIFLWVWPFLCCCCCCPSCCPSKCCQHPEDQPYTKCELLWPTVTLILALLVIISTAIYGFVNASNVGTAFNNMGCSMAVFTDDLLNGNSTTDGTSFFTGLNVFKSNLTDLGAQLNALQTALGDLNDTAAGMSYTNMTQIDSVQTTYTQNLPSGSTTAMTLSYASPINVAVPGGSVTSSFPAVLGTSTTSNTLVYNLYNSIQYARTLIAGIKTYANNFVTNKGDIASQITPIQNTITDLITDVNSMDTKLGDYVSYLKTPGTYGNLGMQGFYGFFIAFSFFSLLGVLLMACCDKPGCRHLMYLTCIFMFLGAFVAFLISIIFSLVVPLFTWTCSYIDVSLADSTGFTTNFGAFLSGSTLTTIQECMPFGTGDIVSQVAGVPGAANGINNLTAVISKLNAFNNTEVKGYITGNLTAFTNGVDAYAKGDITDLDSTNVAILNGLSDPNNSTNKVICNAAFNSDSWVPSVSQNTSYSTAVSCKVSSGHTALKADCNPLTDPNCYGCIDSSQVLTLYSSDVTLLGDLDLKYSATCVFNTQLKNIWNNYYKIRYQNIGVPMTFATTTSGGLTQRIVIATDYITNTANTGSVFTALNLFDSQLTSVKSALSGIQTLTDPKYGMLSGLNCKLFGEDFVNFQNTICGSFYNNMYIIRLTFGICAWGVLFVLCCSVCAGVRHFKQVEKLKRVSDAAMKNDFEMSKQNLNRSKQ